MDDDVIDQTEAGYMELARRLEAYADLRLSPSSAATTRIRTAVMNAAHRRAALMHADETFDAASETTSARAAERAQVASAGTSWRRPLAAILAGVFTLAILAGTAYGARPGGPLYAARLWTEMANLPADLVDRAEAEVNRLEERLQEAQQASTAGDASGTEAALVAYSKIVVEAAKGSGGDPTASAALEVTVTRHVVVLTLMVDSVPSQARSAAEQALSSSTMALDDLDSAGKHTSDRRHPAAHAKRTDGVDADAAVAPDPGLTVPKIEDRLTLGQPAVQSRVAGPKAPKPTHADHARHQRPAPKPPRDKDRPRYDS
jgi:hypothetical protein